MSEGRL